MKSSKPKTRNQKPGQRPRGDRRRQFAVEMLSEDGQALVNDMLLSTRPYYKLDEIVRALKEKTGEKLSRSALDRYYRKVFKRRLQEEKDEQERIIQLTNSILSVVKELKDEDTEELAGRLISAGLLAQATEIREADPIRLLKEDRERKKLELLEKQIEMEVEKIALMRKKLEQAASSAKRAASEIAGRSLTPEEARKIDEQVYGITN